MPLERVSTILRIAEKANTAVIGFNCLDYSTIYSVIATAEEARRPTICMLYPVHDNPYNFISLNSFAAIVMDLAKNVSVPIGLHLDHSSDIDYIEHAVHCGFTSVMYDGSMLAYEENVRNTCRVVDICAPLGVDVEAELGYVGVAGANDYDKPELLTHPEEASKFVSETRIDSLAIAIGNAHGAYYSLPNLDLARLDAINEITSVPLVLHGGSGIPDDQLTEAFSRGINKFNVGTEYWHAWKESAAKHSTNPDIHPNEIARLVQDDLKKYLHKKFQLTKL